MKLPFLQFVRTAPADIVSGLNMLVQGINASLDPYAWEVPTLPAKSGRFYVAANMGRLATPTTSMLPSQAQFMPVTFPTSFTAVTMGLRVTTGSAGNCQVALYANDPILSLPIGAPVYASGNIDTTSTAVVTATISPGVPVGPGSALGSLFWFGFNIDNSGARIMSAETQGLAINSAGCVSAATATQSSIGGTWAMVQTFGTWPTLTSSSLTASALTNLTIPMFTLEAD